jgi:hypothetical protein
MRPEIDDDVVEAVDELVDEHTRVPVDHLTFNQRVGTLVEITRDLEEDDQTGSGRRQTANRAANNYTR